MRNTLQCATRVILSFQVHIYYNHFRMKNTKWKNKMQVTHILKIVLYVVL